MNKNIEKKQKEISQIEAAEQANNKMMKEIDSLIDEQIEAIKFFMLTACRSAKAVYNGTLKRLNRIKTIIIVKENI